MLLGSFYQAHALGGPNLVTPWDSIPDFCSNPTKTTAASGNWSNPAIWSGGTLPTAADLVQISPGQTVTYDMSSATVDCLGIQGTLTFASNINTSLRAGTVMVYNAGSLIVGTTAVPISPGVTAEIVIANKLLDLTSDPGQYGTGLLVWGQIRMNGAIKDPTFIRLTTEPRAGDSTLTLAQAPTGWRVGDQLILPDTRQLPSGISYSQYVPQWEVLTVQNISGSTVTLTAPLQFDHRGARDGDGVLNFLPHVGNLTRNVVVRSENPSGTRGHTLVTYRADADIRYVQFKDMGRTTPDPLDNISNHIGRYPLHMHHVMGPTSSPASGYQFVLQGNAIVSNGNPENHKWGITIHNSNYGLIRDNIVYNIGGSAVMTEDGSESYNVFDHNLVVRAWSSQANRGDGCGAGAFGCEATGFWLRGPNNYVRNNVAANIFTGRADSDYGYKIFPLSLGNVRVPNFPGADTSVTGQYTLRDGNAMPVLEFSDNEVYGATESGMTIWWVGTVGNIPNLSTPESIIRNLHIWNTRDKGFYNYQAYHITFDGLVIRGDLSSQAVSSVGYYGPDYFAHTSLIRNSDIQGMNTGFVMSTNSGGGPQTIQDTILRNRTNVGIPLLWTSSGAADGIPPVQLILRNVRFNVTPSSNNSNPVAISWDNTLTSSYAFRTLNLAQMVQVLVYNYNQIAGNNFQTFSPYQAPTFIMPSRLTLPTVCIELLPRP